MAAAENEAKANLLSVTIERPSNKSTIAIRITRTNNGTILHSALQRQLLRVPDSEQYHELPMEWNGDLMVGVRCVLNFDPTFAVQRDSFRRVPCRRSQGLLSSRENRSSSLYTEPLDVLQVRASVAISPDLPEESRSFSSFQVLGPPRFMYGWSPLLLRSALKEYFESGAYRLVTELRTYIA